MCGNIVLSALHSLAEGTMPIPQVILQKTTRATNAVLSLVTQSKCSHRQQVAMAASCMSTALYI